MYLSTNWRSFISIRPTNTEPALRVLYTVWLHKCITLLARWIKLLTIKVKLIISTTIVTCHICTTYLKPLETFISWHLCACLLQTFFKVYNPNFRVIQSEITHISRIWFCHHGIFIYRPWFDYLLLRQIMKHVWCFI